MSADGLGTRLAAGWQAREPRERRTLVAGAVVLAVVLAWAFAWLPLHRSRDALRERIAADAAALEWMREAAPRLAGAAATPAPGPRDERSLLARADAGAREAGLGDALLRVEPVSAQEVRLSFQSVDFDALAAWLEGFAAAGGLSVTELSVQRAAGVGLVDVRVALREQVR